MLVKSDMLILITCVIEVHSNSVAKHTCAFMFELTNEK